MIKTTNTNPWHKFHFWLVWCFFGSLTVLWSQKKMMLPGFIYFPCFPYGPLYTESCRRFVTMETTDNQIGHNWWFPFNDAIVCLRVAMTTCANAAETCTTSEALVRKQLLPTLHLCFKGTRTDGFYDFIAFWTFAGLHCRLWDVKTQQRFTTTQHKRSNMVLNRDATEQLHK